VSATKKNESPAPRGRGGIALSLCAVVLTALGVWFWASRTSEPVLSGAGPAVKGTLHLETFVLNLADPDQRSYLRVGIDLGLGREAGKGNGNDAPVAEVRDTILGVLGRYRVDELLTEAGKAKVKADTLHALQERLPGLEVEEVYFTEFLIQR
jgi:flagellar basal body-associated protein FliL